MAVPLSFVVLPGLDGTGLLLEELTHTLPGSSVISYPTDRVLGYDELAEHVRARLPKGDFVLIGESFSGPLALRIAADPPTGLKAVVLVASFARLDLPLKAFLSLAAAIVSPRVIPLRLLSLLLLGRWATAQKVAALRTTLGIVSAPVLAARARAALAVDLVGEGTINLLPTLLLQAGGDRLVPRNAGATVGHVCGNLQVVRIDGPHFLLQAEREPCVDAILNFSRRFC